MERLRPARCSREFIREHHHARDCRMRRRCRSDRYLQSRHRLCELKPQALSLQYARAALGQLSCHSDFERRAPQIVHWSAFVRPGRAAGHVRSTTPIADGPVTRPDRGRGRFRQSTARRPVAGLGPQRHGVGPGLLPLLREVHVKLQGTHRCQLGRARVWPIAGRAEAR
jgi:hypothetical protein